MDQPNRTPLQLQRTTLQKTAYLLATELQHVPTYALMPYELAEIQECSQSQEDTFSNGDDDAAFVICHCSQPAYQHTLL